MKATDLREKPQPTDSFTLSQAQTISPVCEKFPRQVCAASSRSAPTWTTYPTAPGLISSIPNRGSWLLYLQRLSSPGRASTTADAGGTSLRHGHPSKYRRILFHPKRSLKVSGQNTEQQHGYILLQPPQHGRVNHPATAGSALTPERLRSPNSLRHPRQKRPGKALVFPGHTRGSCLPSRLIRQDSKSRERLLLSYGGRAAKPQLSPKQERPSEPW